MKTLFLLICVYVLHVGAVQPSGEATVAAHNLTTATGIGFENSTITMTPIVSGTTPTVFLQDIFSFVTNNKQLDFLFQTTPALVDGFGNSIPLTYSYVSVANGTITTILDNTWIEIIPNGTPAYRDGVMSPGYLTLSTGAIPLTQAAGSYSTGPIAVDVMLDGQVSTVIGYLTINALVEEFIVIGFVDTSIYTSGVKFLGNDIDFGVVTPGSAPAPITRDVFVHTNVDTNVQITFLNTPPLISQVDGISTLPVTYSYVLNSVSSNITAGVPFVASNGVNDGTTSVGSITFTPDAASSTQTSGAYSATVNVLVSAM